MVKKLLKYEFSSFAKTILPMELILLGISVFTRFIQFFEKENNTYSIILNSSVVMLIIAMIVCLVMTLVINLVRFYKNLYTAEGYLTLALPVTHTEHIFAKLIFAVLSTVFSVISIVAAGIISTAGIISHEYIKAGLYVLKKAAELIGWQFWIYLLEAVILLIVMCACKYLLYYGCITIGQTAKKNRVLAAFGVYFIYYIICQVIGTVFLISSSLLYKILGIAKILEFAQNHPYTSLHIGFAIILVFELALSLIYYLITKYVMKNKLNLE